MGRRNADRRQGTGTLGPVPLLFRNTSQLGAPPIPSAPAYPISGVLPTPVNASHQAIPTPFTHPLTLRGQP